VFRTTVTEGGAQARQAITALSVDSDVQLRGPSPWVVGRGRGTTRCRDYVVRVDAIPRSGNKVAACGDAGIGSEELRDGDAGDFGERSAGVASAGRDDERAGLRC
jgi:hypothetical protein